MEDLLRALTKHMIEIVGAQRACVVLFDEAQRLVLGAKSSWAPSLSEKVALSDLSQTVIQKVRTTRQAVSLSPMADADNTTSAEGPPPRN